MKKTTPNPQSNSELPEIVLLDKGVIRRVYERRVRLARKRRPTDAQKECAEVFDLFHRQGKRICITRKTANILRTRPARYVGSLLSVTCELQKGRYLRRWARRLREVSFSREDAIILAYGSFGLSPRSNLVPVEMIVTTDLKLVANFEHRKAEIESRFERTTQHLLDPYSTLELPAVLSAAEVLKLV